MRVKTYGLMFCCLARVAFDTLVIIPSIKLRGDYLTDKVCLEDPESFI
jgi:hypothetical protein